MPRMDAPEEASDAACESPAGPKRVKHEVKVRGHSKVTIQNKSKFGQRTLSFTSRSSPRASRRGWLGRAVSFDEDRSHGRHSDKDHLIPAHREPAKHQLPVSDSKEANELEIPDAVQNAAAPPVEDTTESHGTKADHVSVLNEIVEEHITYDPANATVFREFVTVRKHLPASDCQGREATSTTEINSSADCYNSTSKKKTESLSSLNAPLKYSQNANSIKCDNSNDINSKPLSGSSDHLTRSRDQLTERNLNLTRSRDHSRESNGRLTRSSDHSTETESNDCSTKSTDHWIGSNDHLTRSREQLPGSKLNDIPRSRDHSTELPRDHLTGTKDNVLRSTHHFTESRDHLTLSSNQLIGSNDHLSRCRDHFIGSNDHLTRSRDQRNKADHVHVTSTCISTTQIYPDDDARSNLTETCSDFVRVSHIKPVLQVKSISVEVTELEDSASGEESPKQHRAPSFIQRLFSWQQNRSERRSRSRSPKSSPVEPARPVVSRDSSADRPLSSSYDDDCFSLPPPTPCLRSRVLCRSSSLQSRGSRIANVVKDTKNRLTGWYREKRNSAKNGHSPGCEDNTNILSCEKECAGQSGEIGPCIAIKDGQSDSVMDTMATSPFTPVCDEDLESVRRDSIQKWVNSIEDESGQGLGAELDDLGNEVKVREAPPSEQETTPAKKVCRETVTEEERVAATEHDEMALGAEALAFHKTEEVTPKQEPVKIQSIPTIPIVYPISVQRNLLLRSSFSQSRGNSFNSDHSGRSWNSIDQILQERTGDPEEILTGLGFGSVDSEDDLSHRIPDRFLRQPSVAKGITIEDFLDRNPDLKEYMILKHQLSQDGQEYFGQETVAESGQQEGSEVNSRKAPSFFNVALTVSLINRFSSKSKLANLFAQDAPEKLRAKAHPVSLPSGRTYTSILHPDNAEFFADSGLYDDYAKENSPVKRVSNTLLEKLRAKRAAKKINRWSSVDVPDVELFDKSAKRDTLDDTDLHSAPGSRRPTIVDPPQGQTITLEDIKQQVPIDNVKPQQHLLVTNPLNSSARRPSRENLPERFRNASVVTPAHVQASQQTQLDNSERKVQGTPTDALRIDPSVHHSHSAPDLVTMNHSGADKTVTDTHSDSGVTQAFKLPRKLNSQDSLECNKSSESVSLDAASSSGSSNLIIPTVFIEDFTSDQETLGQNIDMEQTSKEHENDGNMEVCDSKIYSDINQNITGYDLSELHSYSLTDNNKASGSSVDKTDTAEPCPGSQNITKDESVSADLPGSMNNKSELSKASEAERRQTQNVLSDSSTNSLLSSYKGMTDSNHTMSDASTVSLLEADPMGYNHRNLAKQEHPLLRSDAFTDSATSFVFSEISEDDGHMFDDALSHSSSHSDNNHFTGPSNSDMMSNVNLNNNEQSYDFHSNENIKVSDEQNVMPVRNMAMWLETEPQIFNEKFEEPAESPVIKRKKTKIPREYVTQCHVKNTMDLLHCVTVQDPNNPPIRKGYVETIVTHIDGGGSTSTKQNQGPDRYPYARSDPGSYTTATRQSRIDSLLAKLGNRYSRSDSRNSTPSHRLSRFDSLYTNSNARYSRSDYRLSDTRYSRSEPRLSESRYTSSGARLASLGSRDTTDSLLGSSFARSSHLSKSESSLSLPDPVVYTSSARDLEWLREVRRQFFDGPDPTEFIIPVDELRSSRIKKRRYSTHRPRSGSSSPIRTESLSSFQTPPSTPLLLTRSLSPRFTYHRSLDSGLNRLSIWDPDSSSDVEIVDIIPGEIKRGSIRYTQSQLDNDLNASYDSTEETFYNHNGDNHMVMKGQSENIPDMYSTLSQDKKQRPRSVSQSLNLSDDIFIGQDPDKSCLDFADQNLPQNKYQATNQADEVMQHERKSRSEEQVHSHMAARSHSASPVPNFQQTNPPDSVTAYSTSLTNADNQRRPNSPPTAEISQEASTFLQDNFKETSSQPVSASNSHSGLALLNEPNEKSVTFKTLPVGLVTHAGPEQQAVANQLDLTDHLKMDQADNVTKADQNEQTTVTPESLKTVKKSKLTTHPQTLMQPENYENSSSISDPPNRPRSPDNSYVTKESHSYESPQSHILAKDQSDNSSDTGQLTLGSHTRVQDKDDVTQNNQFYEPDKGHMTRTDEACSLQKSLHSMLPDDHVTLNSQSERMQNSHIIRADQSGSQNTSRMTNAGQSGGSLYKEVSDGPESFELEEIDGTEDDIKGLPSFNKQAPRGLGLVRTASGQSDSSGFAEADNTLDNIHYSDLDWDSLKIQERGRTSLAIRIGEVSHLGCSEDGHQLFKNQPITPEAVTGLANRDSGFYEPSSPFKEKVVVEKRVMVRQSGIEKPRPQSYVSEVFMEPDDKRISLSDVSEVFLSIDGGKIKEVENKSKSESDIPHTPKFKVRYSDDGEDLIKDSLSEFPQRGKSQDMYTQIGQQEVVTEGDHIDEDSMQNGDVDDDKMYQRMSQDSALYPHHGGVKRRPGILKKTLTLADELAESERAESAVLIPKGQLKVTSPDGKAVKVVSLEERERSRLRRQMTRDREIQTDDITQAQLLCSMLKQSGAWTLHDANLQAIDQPQLDYLMRHGSWAMARSGHTVKMHKHLMDENQLLGQALELYKSDMKSLEIQSLRICKSHRGSLLLEKRGELDSLQGIRQAIWHELRCMAKLLKDREYSLHSGHDLLSLTSLNVIQQMMCLLKEQLFHSEILETMEHEENTQLINGHVIVESHVIGEGYVNKAEEDHVTKSSLNKDRTEDLLQQLAQVQELVLNQNAQQVEGVSSSLQEFRDTLLSEIKASIQQETKQLHEQVKATERQLQQLSTQLSLSSLNSSVDFTEQYTTL